MIRKAVLAAAMLPFFFSVTPARADARSVNPVNSRASYDLLERVRDLTLKCVIQPVSVNRAGRKVYGQTRSTCIELQAQRDRAVLWLGRYQVKAVLVISELADGGDLNHLYLYDSYNRLIAQRQNVAAFGNIFIALAGGTSEFRSH